MNQEYFQKLSDMARKAQEPFRAIAELNVRTLQSLTYLKPEDLSHITKPEQLLEKQIDLAVENGHKALDYMQRSFQIVEQAMLSLVKETENNVEEMQQEMKQNVKKKSSAK